MLLQRAETAISKLRSWRYHQDRLRDTRKVFGDAEATTRTTYA